MGSQHWEKKTDTSSDLQPQSQFQLESAKEKLICSKEVSVYTNHYDNTIKSRTHAQQLRTNTKQIQRYFWRLSHNSFFGLFFKLNFMIFCLHIPIVFWWVSLLCVYLFHLIIVYFCLLVYSFCFILLCLLYLPVFLEWKEEWRWVGRWGRDGGEESMIRIFWGFFFNLKKKERNSSICSKWRYAFLGNQLFLEGNPSSAAFFPLYL